MDQVIKQHFFEIITLFAVIIGAVLTALYKLGWLSFGEKTIKSQKEWDGLERRNCVQHPELSQKVSALHKKIDDIDKKLDGVSEKLQFVLGRLESRWGKIVGDG